MDNISSVSFTYARKSNYVVIKENLEYAASEWTRRVKHRIATFVTRKHLPPQIKLWKRPVAAVIWVILNWYR